MCEHIECAYGKGGIFLDSAFTRERRKENARAFVIRKPPNVSQIRLVNLVDHEPGQLCSVVLETGVVDIAIQASQTVKMEKQQRVVIDVDGPVLLCDSIIRDVPRRKVRSFMSEDNQVLKLSRPVVQIPLVGKLFAVAGIGAALDALRSPALQTSQPVTVAPKAYPTDVENSVPLGLPK